MNKFLSTAAASLVLAATITSCQKDEAADLATRSQQDLTKLQEIATWYAQQPQFKNGNGAMFVMPGSDSASFGVLQNLVFDPVLMQVTGGQVGVFGAAYGNNDFWRENPDSTISVHLVSNQAWATYEDIGTGELWEGSGNLNANFTQSYVTFTLPFPPFDQITFLALDPNQNAFSVQGQGNVTLNGQPGPSKKLRLRWVMNPGGQGGSSIELN